VPLNTDQMQKGLSKNIYFILCLNQNFISYCSILFKMHFL